MRILQFVTTVAGLFMSLSYYPQAYKIYKLKSAQGVSVLTYVIFAFGTTVWTAYGIFTHNLVVVSGFALGVVGSWLVLFLIYKYSHYAKI